MNKFALYLKIWSITTAIVNEALAAMLDGVLDGAEILRIIKAGLQGARIGLSYDEIEQIHIITDPGEMESVFENGDGALVLKKPILDKLNINLHDD